MKLLDGKTVHHLSSSKQPIFPTTDAKFTSKRRMRGGWVQAEDLYMIIMFFKNIVKNSLEALAIWQNAPWKTLGNNFISLLATLSQLAIAFVGIGVGHIYYFLEDVFPNQQGGFHLLRTPRLLKVLLDPEQDPAYEPMPESERPGGFNWGGAQGGADDNGGENIER